MKQSSSNYPPQEVVTYVRFRFYVKLKDGYYFMLHLFPYISPRLDHFDTPLFLLENLILTIISIEYYYIYPPLQYSVFSYEEKLKVVRQILWLDIWEGGVGKPNEGSFEEFFYIYTLYFNHFFAYFILHFHLHILEYYTCGSSPNN